MLHLTKETPAKTKANTRQPRIGMSRLSPSSADAKTLTAHVLKKALLMSKRVLEKYAVGIIPPDRKSETTASKTVKTPAESVLSNKNVSIAANIAITSKIMTAPNTVTTPREMADSPKTTGSNVMRANKPMFIITNNIKYEEAQAKNKVLNKTPLNLSLMMGSRLKLRRIASVKVNALHIMSAT